ncbi:MAG: hypothetical protein Ct9H300mP20_18570 [Gammaproteobacteria bacterium]|nr:MAG: hypothetical protein Ct9H300mP20_18570 [Gammaproteobacteria bacterium]
MNKIKKNRKWRCEILNKRYFILLAGLLFVTSVSSDSLLHKFSDNLADEIECQLCINEIAEETQSLNLENKLFKISLFILDLDENFVFLNPKSYYTRAPPKI